MTTDEFEGILDKAVEQLGREVRNSTDYHKPLAFQARVCEVLVEVAANEQIHIQPSFHPHAFPDIKANGYGVEVKSTIKDSWLSVGNSIFEGMRDDDVKRIYVVFGKMGGMSSVRWSRYEDCITHVRISHAPRFVLEMERDSPLFDHMDVDYAAFSTLTPHEKMAHVRKYSRGRLKPGERLWWLEDDPDEEHTLPLEVRLYMRLEEEEKTKLRGEAALLCPQIVKGSRQRGKYTDVALYLLTYHGVFCPQARDLFTAGSVAHKESTKRGGKYIIRALKYLEGSMRNAAYRLEDALFEEYWGEVVPPERRIKEWLARADEYATDWVPSDELFQLG